MLLFPYNIVCCLLPISRRDVMGCESDSQMILAEECSDFLQEEVGLREKTIIPQLAPPTIRGAM